MTPSMDDKKMERKLLKIGAGVALLATRPLKKVETSSSSKSYTKPDGTIVTEKSS